MLQSRPPAVPPEKRERERERDEPSRKGDLRGWIAEHHVGGQLGGVRFEVPYGGQGSWFIQENRIPRALSEDGSLSDVTADFVRKPAAEEANLRAPLPGYPGAQKYN